MGDMQLIIHPTFSPHLLRRRSRNIRRCCLNSPSSSFRGSRQKVCRQIIPSPSFRTIFTEIGAAKYIRTTRIESNFRRQRQTRMVRKKYIGKFKNHMLIVAVRMLGILFSIMQRFRKKQYNR